jgi:hypothetical protein
MIALTSHTRLDAPVWEKMHPNMLLEKPAQCGFWGVVVYDVRGVRFDNRA